MNNGERGGVGQAQVPHEAVRQILASLTSGSSWEFKLPTDTEFIHKSDPQGLMSCLIPLFLCVYTF